MIIEKQSFDFSNLAESEWNFLESLKIGLLNRVSTHEIRNILDNRDKKGRRSIVFDLIVFDVKGFYEMAQTEFSSIVLVEKFRNSTRDEVFDLLLYRLNSVKKGFADVPERLYRPLITRVNYEQRLIDVIEVQMKPWDYLLLKSPYYREEYFIKLHYEKGSTRPEIIKLNNEDSKKIESMTESEIDQMVKRYRVGS